MIEVTVTCAWCQMKVVTGLEKPVPDGWVVGDVATSKMTESEDTFCDDAHKRLYVEAAPAAWKAAVESYATTFLARMNDARTAWNKLPKPAPVVAAPVVADA